MVASEKRLGMEDSANNCAKGMHVLAIDDDHVSLTVLEALLRRCNYRATLAGDLTTALRILRKGNEKFDLVISSVLMPYKDGFSLLKIASLEMDLPVIILSAYADTKTIKRGIALGVCQYLVKPVRDKEIMNIWQHVVRKKMSILSRDNKGGNVDDGDKMQSETASGERVFEKRSRKYLTNDRNDGDDSHENEENMSELSSWKKPRMTWTNELKGKFVEAVHQIGIENAAPKKILSMMGVHYITRESVASYLQKYRLRLRRFMDGARMNCNPLVDASERYNSIWNKPTSFSQDYGPGRYRSSAPIASVHPTNHFTRICHPSTLGERNALVHGSNMFSKDVMHGSSLLPNVRLWPSSNNSYASMPNDTMRSNAFASTHSGNNSSYGNILCGERFEESKGNHSGNSHAYRSNVGITSPINLFLVQSSYRLGNQPSIQRNPFEDIGNCLGNSWQADMNFYGISHKKGTESLGPSQENLPNISQLPNLATSSVGQMLMCQNEAQNQMAAVMSNTRSMACTHDKTMPFQVPNNNHRRSVEMLSCNFAPDTTSRTSFGLSGTSARPNQMLNGGGAYGAHPTQQDGTIHLETIADQLKYINDCLLETDVPEGSVYVEDNMPNKVSAYGAHHVQEGGTVHQKSIADQLKYINGCLLETDVSEGSVYVDENMPNEDFISIYDYIDIA